VTGAQVIAIAGIASAVVSTLGGAMGSVGMIGAAGAVMLVGNIGALFAERQARRRATTKAGASAGNGTP